MRQGKQNWAQCKTNRKALFFSLDIFCHMWEIKSGLKISPYILGAIFQALWCQMIAEKHWNSLKIFTATVEATFMFRFIKLMIIYEVFWSFDEGFFFFFVGAPEGTELAYTFLPSFLDWFVAHLFVFYSKILTISWCFLVGFPWISTVYSS